MAESSLGHTHPVYFSVVPRAIQVETRAVLRPSGWADRLYGRPGRVGRPHVHEPVLADGQGTTWSKSEDFQNYV